MPSYLQPGGKPPLAGVKTFVQCMASKTGLNPYVLYAWVALETGVFVVTGAGAHYNYLNIRGSGSAGSSKNGFAWYGSPEEACEATYHLLLTAQSWTGYAKILAAAGKDSTTQVTAIVNSRWCYNAKTADHRCYGGVSGFLTVVHTVGRLISPSGEVTPGDVSPLTTGEQAASDPVGSFATGAGIIGGSLLKFAAGAGKRIVFVLGGISAAAFGLYFIAKETGVGAGIADKAKTAAKGVALL